MVSCDSCGIECGTWLHTNIDVPYVPGNLSLLYV